MPKYLYAFILSIFIYHTSAAQEQEFGIRAGLSGYIGDINTNNPFKFTDESASIFYRYNVNKHNGFRVQGTYAKVQAADANSKYKEQKLRNLSFKSDIIELAGIYDFNFLPYLPGSKKFRFAPYTSVGIALFNFNPTAEYQGNTYDLRNLGTEGQGNGNGRKYGQQAVAAIYGAGIKYNFAGAFTLGAELMYRYAFTDYLDDVSTTYTDADQLQKNNGTIAAALADRSGEVNNGVNIGAKDTQRGDATKPDQYMTVTLHLSYTILTRKCPTF